MKFPPFVYSLAFWSALSWLLAGVAGLLVYFGVIGSEFGYAAPVILAAIQAVLKFLNITPELQAKGLI
jgi:hypothetical protein